MEGEQLIMLAFLWFGVSLTFLKLFLIMYFAGIVLSTIIFAITFFFFGRSLTYLEMIECFAMVIGWPLIIAASFYTFLKKK